MTFGNIMRFLEFRNALKTFTLFSINEIKKIDNNFHRRRLNEWQEKGYIKKIIRGYYIFSDLEVNEKVLFEIANKIHSPSYVSFEMALSYYHLIPESVYVITSASTLLFIIYLYYAKYVRRGKRLILLLHQQVLF